MSFIDLATGGAAAAAAQRRLGGDRERVLATWMCNVFVEGSWSQQKPWENYGKTMGNVG